MFEVFEHTADLGLRITAPTLESLFEEAGRALISVIVERPAAILPNVQVDIVVTGDELAYLFFDWLNELLYTFESKHLVFCDFQVTKTPQGVSAICRGETLDPDRHMPDHEVKAITYHGLTVQPTPGGYMAEVIVDI